MLHTPAAHFSLSGAVQSSPDCCLCTRSCNRPCLDETVSRECPVTKRARERQQTKKSNDAFHMHVGQARIGAAQAQSKPESAEHATEQGKLRACQRAELTRTESLPELQPGLGSTTGMSLRQLRVLLEALRVPCAVHSDQGTECTSRWGLSLELSL